MQYPATRLRRLRQKPFLRQLCAENQLLASDLIAPFFVEAGQSLKTPIHSMPGIYRYTPDLLVEEVQKCYDLGIQAIALFPSIAPEKKSLDAAEAYHLEGLIPSTIRLLKEHIPEMGIMADVALDPYTSHGQDGLLDNEGQLLNDQTIEVLIKQALVCVKSGADMVAPSDMMDGRIGGIREALEASGHPDACIVSYAAKYASHFYGPFREAVGSSGCLGKADKRTYQMDPANSNEALREVALDIEEGADILLIKPGLPYLDVLWRVKAEFQMPTWAYQVSGEYAMLQAAVDANWLPYEAIVESLLCFKRAGADAIITYFAPTIAAWLKHN